MKNLEYCKISFSLVLGFLAEIYDKYSVMLAFMSFAIILDVITGLIKAKCKGQKLSSKKGTKGFFKKFAFIFAYAFGVFLDLFLPYVAQSTGIDVEYNCFFGLIIGAYITLNESISICENLYECNNDILPPYIGDLIKKTRDKINKNGD